MTNSEIDQLYERLARLSDATKEKTGDGSSWTYCFRMVKRIDTFSAGSNPMRPICGDLANLSKHAKLTNSRSGLFPYFGRVAFSIPKETVGSITFRASEVQASVADPRLVTVSLPVFDQTCNQIGDAFEYAERGLAALERICQIIEN